MKNYNQPKLKKFLASTVLFTMIFSNFWFIWSSFAIAPPPTPSFTATKIQDYIAATPETKASITLNVNDVPWNGKSITIWSCIVDFANSNNNSNTSDLNCSGWATIRMKNNQYNDTVSDIATSLRSLTGVTDIVHWTLITSWTNPDAIFTESLAHTWVISFSSTTSRITATSTMTWVVWIPAQAQIVTFEPLSPINWIVYRAILNGTNYNYTATGWTTVDDLLTHYQTTLDWLSSVSCTKDTTKVTCTSESAWTWFTFDAKVVDETAPTIVLNGTWVTVERFGPYDELWATWTDNVDGTGIVETPFSGWVDLNTVWDYVLSYKYTDIYWANDSDVVTRTVSVVDTTAPTWVTVEYTPASPTNWDVIATLTWANETITWTLAHTFTWNTVYTFNYSDLSWNTWSIDWEVTWIDKIAPTIVLNWSASVSLTKWTSYTELWATSNDNVDGTWTVLTPFTGSVDINTAWTYTLQYKKIDTAWNVSNIVTRTVIITQPVISSGWWSGNGWWNSGGGSFYYAPTNTLKLKTIENTWSIEASWLDETNMTWSICSKQVADNIAFTLIKKYIKNLSIRPNNNAIKIDVLKMALLLAYWNDYCNADPSKATFKAVAKILLSWHIDWNNKISKPNGSVTRIEAVKLIINALWVSATDSKKTIFYDIKDNWMNKYLNKALELWIITNWRNFRPMDNVSRYEISVMISKAMMK